LRTKNALESIGWLSGSGYLTVIDEEAKKQAKSSRDRLTGDEHPISQENKDTNAFAASASS
jgi:hypothetical protein